MRTPDRRLAFEAPAPGSRIYAPPAPAQHLRGRGRRGPAPWKLVLGGATAAIVLAASPAAHACGAAYPGGPVMCEYPRRSANGAATDTTADGGGATEARPIARVSTSYAFTSTTIKWGEDRRTDLTRHAAFANLQLPLNASGSLTGIAGIGGIIGGSLDHGAARDTIGPGIAANVGVAARAYRGSRYLPFVQLTLGLSFAHMGTETDGAGTRTDGSISPTGPSSPTFTAADARGGVIVGKSIANVVTPYVTGRVFGGPIAWRYDGDKVTGRDAYQYQVGGGVAVALFKGRLDVFAEGIPLGEKGVAAGIGTTFF